MKIKDLDETLRDEFYVGDFVSEKVEGGYKLKVISQITADDKRVFTHLKGDLLDGEDELNWVDGLFFVEKSK